MSLTHKELSVNQASFSLSKIQPKPVMAPEISGVVTIPAHTGPVGTIVSTKAGTTSTGFFSKGSLSRLRLQLHTIQCLARKIPACKTVRITYNSGMSFFSEIVPAILIGRFFGKELILQYQSNKAEEELEDYGRGLHPFLKLCHRIEVTSEYTAHVFRRYNLSTSIVPLQVDPTLFSPRLIKSVQPRIISTRRHDRGNNLVGVIKAFRRVKQKYPRAELIILGDGPQRRWLEELVISERISGVTCTGYISHEETAKYFATADIYLNNATLDGLPLSLLEALSAGLPVVSTKVGDIPAVIQHGVNGLLIDNNDPPMIANSIIELVETPSLVAKLSSGAVEAARNYHTKNASVESTPAV